MKCPACYNELVQVHVGNLIVDACHSCGGVWFDAFELRRVDEQEEIAGEPLLQIPRDPRVVVDPKRKRACPRCEEVKLHRHFFSPKRRVEVDECPNCAGCWLDADELGAIRAERSAAIGVQKVQEAILSVETIRYIYRLQQNQGD